MDEIVMAVVALGPAALIGALSRAAIAAKLEGKSNTALFAAIAVAVILVCPIPALTGLNWFGGAITTVLLLGAGLLAFSVPERAAIPLAFLLAVVTEAALGVVINAGRRDGLTILYLPALLGTAWAVVPIIARHGVRSLRIGAVAATLFPIALFFVVSRP